MAGELKHMKSELSVEEEKSREERVSLQMNLESTEKSLRQIQSQLMLAEKVCICIIAFVGRNIRVFQCEEDNYLQQYCIHVVYYQIIFMQMSL